MNRLLSFSDQISHFFCPLLTPASKECHDEVTAGGDERMTTQANGTKNVTIAERLLKREWMNEGWMVEGWMDEGWMNEVWMNKERTAHQSMHPSRTDGRFQMNQASSSFLYPPFHQFTHRIIHSSVYSLIHSSIQPFICTLNYQFTHSSFPYSCFSTHPFMYISPIHSLFYPFTSSVI